MSASAATRVSLVDRIPPHGYFVVSAVFHYLGPAFAVLLFAHVAPLGVAWLRIASAAVIFALWRRPWRYWRGLPARERRIVVALGFVLAAMNCCFYEAIARLPLGTVGAIEFLGPIGLAALGLRTPRNLAALIAAAAGVYLLTDVRIAGEPLGFLFAFANCALFVAYIMLGHRIAADGGSAGIDRLGAAMLIAAIFSFPIGILDALVFRRPQQIKIGQKDDPRIQLQRAQFAIYIVQHHHVEVRWTRGGAVLALTLVVCAVGQPEGHHEGLPHDFDNPFGRHE